MKHPTARLARTRHALCAAYEALHRARTRGGPQHRAARVRAARLERALSRLEQEADRAR